MYTTSQISELISNYINKVGNSAEIIKIQEGVLGYGTMILCDASNQYFHFVIREFQLNEWSSAHKIRKYRKIPKKYLQLIDKKVD